MFGGPPSRLYRRWSAKKRTPRINGNVQPGMRRIGTGHAPRGCAAIIAGALLACISAAPARSDEPPPPAPAVPAHETPFGYRRVYAGPYVFDIPEEVEFSKRWRIDFCVATFRRDGKLLMRAYYGSFPSFPALKGDADRHKITNTAQNGVNRLGYEEAMPDGRRGEALYSLPPPAVPENSPVLHAFYNVLDEQQAATVRSILKTVRRDPGAIGADGAPAAFVYGFPLNGGSLLPGTFAGMRRSYGRSLPPSDLKTLEEIARRSPRSPLPMQEGDVHAVIDLGAKRDHLWVGSDACLRFNGVSYAPLIRDRLRIAAILDGAFRPGPVFEP
jgi:hypothetical protein